MKRTVKIYYTFEENDKKYYLQRFKSFNLSTRKVAQKLDISPTYLSDVLNGKKNISAEKLEKLDNLIYEEARNE
jgi:transcriptional regulator with XRE-family HTH domain